MLFTRKLTPVTEGCRQQYKKNKRYTKPKLTTKRDVFIYVRRN